VCCVSPALLFNRPSHVCYVSPALLFYRPSHVCCVSPVALQTLTCVLRIPCTVVLQTPSELQVPAYSALKRSNTTRTMPRAHNTHQELKHNTHQEHTTRTKGTQHAPRAQTQHAPRAHSTHQKLKHNMHQGHTTRTKGTQHAPKAQTQHTPCHEHTTGSTNIH